MEALRTGLPKGEWLDREAAIEPEKEHVEDVRAIKAYRDIGKRNEAEMKDVLGKLDIRFSEVEDKDRHEVSDVEAMAEQAKAELSGQGPEDEGILAEELTLEMNVAPLTVVGSGPGHYYDFSPYHCWHRCYYHNEGGVTQGHSSCNRASKRMQTYSRARGDGAGFWDDNYTTCWSKLYFAFWPRQNGHVRAFVPYQTRGWFYIYANDKWYNSKSAYIDVDVRVQLHQNMWGAYHKDDVFHISSQNINRQGRIDRNATMYSGSMAIGAEQWVIAEVALRSRAYADGSGSTSTVDFWGTDYVHVPYVRFDFS
ncbi:hypothetical protein AB2B41_05890 [Marimonas sp. MJW-29]|uniref:Uncharacterized protein n=1 Tax=Sulfitobacter sediminis TaxID=3234186 RepID=A0ABV3RM20_9RHOB